MTAIVAAHYAETVARLRANPIIKQLAAGLVTTPLDSLAHPDSSPRFEFMQAANRKFRDSEQLNTGNPVYTPDTGPRHIGAVAEALIAERAATRDAFASVFQTTDDTTLDEAIRRAQAGEDLTALAREIASRKEG
jgi:hypothetical protein